MPIKHFLVIWLSFGTSYILGAMYAFCLCVAEVLYSGGYCYLLQLYVSDTALLKWMKFTVTEESIPETGNEGLIYIGVLIVQT